MVTHGLLETLEMIRKQLQIMNVLKTIEMANRLRGDVANEITDEELKQLKIYAVNEMTQEIY